MTISRPRRRATFVGGAPRVAASRRSATVWGLAALYGFVSAFGVAFLRTVAGSLVSGAGAIGGVALLFAFGVCVVFEASAFLLMRLLMQQTCPDRSSGGPALGVLALGAVADVVLNRVLVAAHAFPLFFGLVSVMLFCLPYPLAFELVVVRSRTRWAAAATVAVVLALAVGPIRSAQERLAVQQWYAAHPGLDRRLLQGVDWPGGEPDALEFGPFGARVTVFFQDSNIDGVSDAVVTVAPPDADPCGSIGITDGEGTRQSAPERCDRVAPGVWAVAAGDFTGRVERRGGVLLTLSVDSNRGSQDDLAAVARSLHPLNDHQLWPYLGTFSLLDWLVL